MDQQDERERVRAARAERRAEGKGCPCCGAPVHEAQPDNTLLALQVLRQNDLHEVFRITGDRRLVFAADVTPQEAAVAFAEAVTKGLQKAAQVAADANPGRDRRQVDRDMFEWRVGPA